MLEDLESGLEAFFRAATPLSSTAVDVSFEAPDREWSAQLTRPTVNLFMWDLRRSASRSRSGVRVVEENGQLVQQFARPVVELRYVVTAWASEHSDERSLLSDLTYALLKYGAISKEFLPPSFAALPEPKLLMARSGEEHIDVFRAVDGQLKPGINVVLISEFDIGTDRAAAPPASQFEVRSSRIGGGDSPPRRRVAGEVVDASDRGAIGAVVRAPLDATCVDPSGRFLLRADTGDVITLETEPPLTTKVPAAGGVRFE